MAIRLGTEGQLISFVYFTNRECCASIAWAVDWAIHHTYFTASRPNLLPYSMLAQHPLLIKYTKLMGCAFVKGRPFFAVPKYFPPVPDTPALLLPQYQYQFCGFPCCCTVRSLIYHTIGCRRPVSLSGKDYQIPLHTF